MRLLINRLLSPDETTTGIRRVSIASPSPPRARARARARARSFPTFRQLSPGAEESRADTQPNRAALNYRARIKRYQQLSPTAWGKQERGPSA